MTASARPVAVSGVKPSGALHLGNLEGAVRGWVALQETHDLFCMIANWHAYTVTPESPERVQADTRELALDLLAAGLDPARATLFVQSQVPEHAELYLLLSTVTPVSWLERVPTYKDLTRSGKVASPSHALLGYPVLQAADILLYRATDVPVGRDQLPHLELAREIARRWNGLYGKVLAEPNAVLGPAPIVPGLDGEKMSKSRGNTIDLRDSPEATERKVLAAFTTPSKIRASDPGIPEGCTVCQLRRLYDPEGYRASWEEDRRGERGCIRNKWELVRILNDALAPLRARRRALAELPHEVDAILAEGARRARVAAQRTLAEVKAAMRL